jgi:hypothetical protein
VGNTGPSFLSGTDHKCMVLSPGMAVRTIHKPDINSLQSTDVFSSPKLREKYITGRFIPMHREKLNFLVLFSMNQNIKQHNILVRLSFHIKKRKIHCKNDVYLVR